MGWNVFHITFSWLIPITVVFAYLGKPAPVRNLGYSLTFFKLRLHFLLAWYVCVAVDWLQGPYLFGLYSEIHKLPKHKIAILYVVGYAVAAVAGPLTGVLGDRFGRRKCCMAYCAIYVLSCATSHFTWYPLLIFGRVLGDVAFEILYTAFESWLVHAHRSKELPAPSLDNIFAFMWFGNYLIAALAGCFSQFLADAIPLSHWDFLGEPMVKTGAYTAPFDAAIILCFVGAYLVSLWDDDKADALINSPASDGDDVERSDVSALSVLSSVPVLLVGLVVVGVESTMFLFIFHWTDALKTDDGFSSHGYAFSSFMMCAMIGSTISSKVKLRAETVVFVSSALIALAWASIVGIGFITDPGLVVGLRFAAFLLFEAYMGLYFPAMSTVKSLIVPERSRSFVYTAYRAPMNAIVTIVQLLDLSFSRASVASVILAVLACSAMQFLVHFHLGITDSLLPKSSEPQVELGGARLRRNSFRNSF